MGTNLDAAEIAIRLVLTLAAGGILGLNRTERDRPAGLRTTLLVTLAASVGMIETNILLNTNGKPPNSFAVADVMRIPLGILSGIGFIGGGTILRRENLVIGVTTAATLWFATMIGLCLGGGQLALGCTATLLGALILWCLRWVERFIHQNRHAVLSFAAESQSAEEEIRTRINASGFKVVPQTVTYLTPALRRKVSWQIEWMSTAGETAPPDFLREIAARDGVTELEWREAQSAKT